MTLYGVIKLVVFGKLFCVTSTPIATLYVWPARLELPPMQNEQHDGLELEVGEGGRVVVSYVDVTQPSFHVCVGDGGGREGLA